MAVLQNLQVILSANTRQFESSMKQQTKTTGALQKNVSTLTKSMTGFMAAAAAVTGLKASARAYGDFNKGIVQSTAIMKGVTSDLRNEMEETARSISRESVTSAADLSKSYYYLASAGLDAKQSIEALAIVEKFSVAGAFDMATATDLLTDAQSALGLTVKNSTDNMENMIRVSDVLTKANTLANASTEQFSRALTNKAGSAIKILNKDIEEGVAVLAAFADQGVKAEEAGSALYIVSRDLQKANTTAKSAWNELGLSVYDSTGKMRNYADIIEQLEGLLDGMSDAQKRTTITTLGFQDKSFAALQTLIGTSEKIREYEAELRKAGGTTGSVADKQLGAFNSQMKKAWNNIKDAGIVLGESLAPAILFTAEAITILSSSFKKLGGYFESVGQAYQMDGLLGALNEAILHGISGDTNKRFEEYLRNVEGAPKKLEKQKTETEKLGDAQEKQASQLEEVIGTEETLVTTTETITSKFEEFFSALNNQTPLEKFNEQMKVANEALVAGIINTEKFNAAKKMAETEFTTPEDGITPDEYGKKMKELRTQRDYGNLGSNKEYELRKERLNEQLSTWQGQGNIFEMLKEVFTPEVPKPKVTEPEGMQNNMLSRSRMGANEYSQMLNAGFGGAGMGANEYSKMLNAGLIGGGGGQPMMGGMASAERKPLGTAGSVGAGGLFGLAQLSTLGAQAQTKEDQMVNIQENMKSLLEMIAQNTQNRAIAYG